MAKRGTTAKIDMGELEKLAMMQCTDEEIAAWFGVTARTIERRRKNPAFAEVMERGKAKGRLSMRRAQMKLLDQGNATMAIWLGKQYLGQTDQSRHELNGTFTTVGVLIPVGNAPGGQGIAQRSIEASGAEQSLDISGDDNTERT
jgi:hypothetical protein